MDRISVAWVGALAVSAVLIVPKFALAASARDEANTPSVEDLRNLSIDDLANLQVTSLSKRPESLSEAPAAVYVITADDIRRSGATSLPQALRLAPNLEVAQVNAYSWTVTARGFNSPETANKLLVLVNGRSVYEPIASGVLWQQVDVDLTNVTRIEVISGPGGTLWGANAVNGVINIITSQASAAQGPAFQVSAGGYERNASLRYGGKAGDVWYKIYAHAFDFDATEPVDPADTTNDAFSGGNAEVRLGGKFRGADWSLKGETYTNHIADNGGTFSGQSYATSWNRTGDSGVSTAVNAWFSRDIRNEPTLYESREAFDVEFQRARTLGDHQLMWGGEFRYWWEDFRSFNLFHFADPKTDISIGSVFAQDEITLRPGLRLTLGLKGETNSYSGFDWLPNVRLAWQPDDNQLLWAAVSRAVRTPNRIERELEAPNFLIPAPDFKAEKLTAIEAGWRAQPADRVSLSLSAYYNRYTDLRTDAYTPVTIFPLQLQNGARGTTWGLEAWAQFDVNQAWRVSAGANLLHKKFRLKPGAVDAINAGVQGQDPDYQAQVRSQWQISKTVEFDLSLRAVGKVDLAPVKAYQEADAHLEWRVTDTLALALDGHNLLHARHIEVWDPSTAPVRYIPRSVFATLRYGF
ncbi:TonB-dependent receptor plug domain-containing protein [Asticcacaulis solisilvae]|uniref:TonB-dependent receptor plug domain-containing protein n=1 Tax=Asticcacaulis solisilvae TaxID=1217274 RepID=UPI003FD8C5D6